MREAAIAKEAMTERQWVKATNPYDMIKDTPGKISSRKLRLFACACCREFESLWRPEGRAAVAVALRFADKQATRSELAAARASVPTISPRTAEGWASNAVGFSCAASPANAACWAFSTSCEAAVCGGRRREDYHRSAVALLRHVAGNPFQPAKRPSVPATVEHLAAALYDGEDCHFALRDALLEVGLDELAGHFAEPFAEGHPRSCWVVDLLLRKK